LENSSIQAITDRVDPPYGTILSELAAGQVIPFLGSGASRVGYVEGAPGFLPSGGDLAEMLALDTRFPSDDIHDRRDLSTVASYFEDSSNRKALRRRLRRVFSGALHPCNSLHRLLAQIADKLVIVTTNYDTLLEQAFQEAGKPFDLAVYPADNDEVRNALLWWPHDAKEPRTIEPKLLDVDDIGQTNLIYKIHGTVRHDAEKWDSFVITEGDCIQFLSQMSSAVPPAFKEYFKDRAFLFLGYALRDWNMRVLLKQVSASRTASSPTTSWAILNNSSTFEKKIWQQRHVDMFDVTLEEFVREMESEIARR
jgi:hypothetical protein